jgi:signal transduction histidine kinase
MDLLPSARSTRFKYWCALNSEPSPERTIGLGRVWAAVGVLLLVSSDFSLSDLQRKYALFSACAYLAYSLLALLLLRKHRTWPNTTRLTLHCVDVFVAASVALLVRKSEAALFLLLLFVLVASAQRWGPSRMLWTAGTVVVLLIAELLLIPSVAPHANFPDAIRPGAGYVLLAGFFLFATGTLWQLTKTDAAERWESSARAAQRVRAIVSRTLHDGAIQCLFTVEFRLEKLRRGSTGMSCEMSEELGELQRLVRRSEAELREIVEQGRPADLGPKSFVQYLADLTAEFQQDTGISARFVSADRHISPSPAVAGEVVRIVEEALLNVKKHSGARNVSIELGAAQGRWKLLIDDDGQGFDFSGRLCMLDLETKDRGPYVIRERVSTLGGELEVESIPGRGARLEIAFPKDALG